jgi:hypothetical protein
MPRCATAVAPKSVARGAPRSGDRAAAGMPDRAKVYMGRQQSATGSHLPLEGRHRSALRGLARFYRKPHGTGLCGRSVLSGSWRRGAPEHSPRDPAKQGSGSGGDASTAPRYCCGAGIPLRGRIFLRKTLLRPSRSHHSRRRLSRIPSRKATSRQRRFVQRFPNTRWSVHIYPSHTWMRNARSSY